MERYFHFPIFTRAGKIKTKIKAIELIEEANENIIYYIEKDEPIRQGDTVTIHFIKLDKFF